MSLIDEFLRTNVLNDDKEARLLDSTEGDYKIKYSD